MYELKLKKCTKCKSVVQVFSPSKTSITCCGKDMIDVLPNQNDASPEKHLPVYEIVDNNLKITVHHVMEQDHYIEWILVKNLTGSKQKLFSPQDEISMIIPYEKGSIIYSYCNKHGLWMTKVD